MRTKKVHVPKMTIGKHAKKMIYKPIKGGGDNSMLPHDGYNHGRPHTSKKLKGPRLPAGATL